MFICMQKCPERGRKLLKLSSASYRVRQKKQKQRPGCYVEDAGGQLVTSRTHTARKVKARGFSSTLKNLMMLPGEGHMTNRTSCDLQGCEGTPSVSTSLRHVLPLHSDASFLTAENRDCPGFYISQCTFTFHFNPFMQELKK